MHSKKGEFKPKQCSKKTLNRFAELIQTGMKGYETDLRIQVSSKKGATQSQKYSVTSKTEESKVKSKQCILVSTKKQNIKSFGKDFFLKEKIMNSVKTECSQQTRRQTTDTIIERQTFKKLLTQYQPNEVINQQSFVQSRISEEPVLETPGSQSTISLKRISIDKFFGGRETQQSKVSCLPYQSIHRSSFGIQAENNRKQSIGEVVIRTDEFQHLKTEDSNPDFVKINSPIFTESDYGEKVSYIRKLRAQPNCKQSSIIKLRSKQTSNQQQPKTKLQRNCLFFNCKNPMTSEPQMIMTDTRPLR